MTTYWPIQNFQIQLEKWKSISPTSEITLDPALHNPTTDVIYPTPPITCGRGDNCYIKCRHVIGGVGYITSVVGSCNAGSRVISLVEEILFHFSSCI